MDYLNASEYEKYGLEAVTPASWVAAASALMDAHCRRSTLGIASNVERVRLIAGRNVVRLSFLPVAQIVSARARYGAVRGGDVLTGEVARAFSLPGSWIDVDVNSLDVAPETGEVTFGMNPLGLAFNEVEVMYMAGFEVLPEAVKCACAQVVRNAQATPALNVRASSLDRMHLEYFSDTLLDSGVRAMLAPYVAQRVG
ncbi:MAG TPA: hypothetical protein VN622_02515 [Clostridia bacterium]|nr:hypothetical protein [Clostridia bacterium]